MIEVGELLLRFLTGGILLLTLVFVVGIVWRVEAELDTAYKWYTLAVIFSGVAEVVEIIPGFSLFSWGELVSPAARLLAAVALFLGMYYMRDLVRRMDGEKNSK